MPDSERYQQYEVLRRADGSLWELGRGAMGITYKAFDTNLRCPVALKVINSTYLQNETARQRFLNEARAAAALRHPNVASVFNLGTDQSNYFYVMEFIDGETVEALVKRKGRLEPIEALNITQQVARALGAAAKRRLVHRDLKPSNLMLVDDDGESVVKVIDFGLAKSVKESTDESAALTMGGFVGTPHFASPEQVEEGEVDVRSDIYSLGATLYFTLTGKAPFSGSVGQVMSQHLYKPIAVEPLADVPQCVIALIQCMLEKDRTKRPQTPRALQDAIVSCLQEIRGESTRSIPEVGEAEPEVLTPGAILARQYRLIEEPGEILQGLHFIAEDLIRTRLVRLLVLRPDFVSDPHWFTLVQVAVERLRNAPHSMLRAIYSLETAGGRAILVEENIVGPSLQDVLRSRGILTASEAVRLASLLAPLADHASANRLEYVDFSLLGIHFVAGDSETSQGQPDLLKQPLTDFEHLEPKVNGIDFSFTPPQATTLTDFGTQLQHGGGAGPRSSYVRSLSLLVYELLGGPRTRVETTGRYKPIAALTQEGNAVLRRGLVDEFSSATELARQLKAIVDPRKSAMPLRDGTRSQVAKTDRISREHAESGAVGNESKEQPRATKDPAIQTSPPEIPSGIASTRTSTPSVPVLILAGVVSFCVGIIGYLIYLQLGPPPEEQSTKIPALSIQTDPSGAAILLDGKPPQSPNTFTQVPFGTHQLTVSLNDYEPIKQDIEVHQGMAPEIHLKLKPTQEIAALSVQTDPPGASILLDGKPPQSPNTFTHVPFGTHQLTATLNDYEPIKQDIEVRRGMAPEIRLKLKPTQEIAALSVQTDPSGASILLDGKPPQSPNTFTHVPFGTHQLTATLNDYEPIKQDIEVRKGMVPEIHLKLKPTQEIAALSIQTDPPGAAILLDGKPPQSPNTFTHVPFGTHQLTATLNDYESIRQDIEVRRGMAPEIHLKLKPSQEIAALSVQTDPPGASILLDGKSPQSPNTFTHVPFGTHQLTATLDKYDASNQEIQVAKGMPSEIHVTLKPKSSPLDALVAEVKKYGEGTPEQVTALVRLVQFCTSSKTSDAEEHTKELAEAIEQLRTKTPPISKDEFSAAYKASIKDAADLNILPAILWLAENEKGRESFDRFLHAANLGDSYAMMNVGKLYLYKATAADDVQAFGWLKRAYESAPPNLEAGAYLGFCYLHGRGTKKDENEGKKITLSLANQSVVFAMTNAGLLLAEEAQETREKASKGTTQIRQQLTAEADALEVQARQWWERAAEKNDWSASARLGQFYQAGLGGLTKSDEQAERLYQEGVKHGNTLSKYYYALFLIEKKPDRRSEAEDLMSQAATAGVQSARKWCEQNNVKLNKAVPDVEQQ